MRCFVRKVGAHFHAAFDWGGVSYTHSLRTKDEREAEVRLAPIRDTLYRLEQGTIQMPSGSDPKAFILSGGQHTSKPQSQPTLTIGALADLYLASRKVEPNTLNTLGLHLKHVKRILTPEKPLDSIRLADLQDYVKTRSREEYRGRSIQSYTIRKEVRTFRQAWTWAVEMGHTKAAPGWRLKSLDMDKDRGREPFRTYSQIEQKSKRGGLSEDEEASLWETLYLTSEELSGLLDFVKEKAIQSFVYPMVAFVALTGCRRSEMVRSLLDDWDLENGRVIIREKKKDTSVRFTTREIDIHPRLAEVMTAWFEAHPGGQFAISQDGGPITIHRATDHLRRTLSADSRGLL
jgi:integrase